MQEDPYYFELSYYTLSHKGPDFIHQHLVDAYTAQIADEHTKPIAITYALAGLYLHLLKNYTGKEVQLAHMALSKKSKVFEKINLPTYRGSITVIDILKIPEGVERDHMIHAWCQTVWDAFAEEQQKIIEWTNKLL